MSGLCRNLRYNENMKFLDSPELKDFALFCKRRKIREFAVFGSILLDDFKPESDVDILVTFSQNAEWGLFDHVQIRNELESMLNRKVDLVTRRALEQTQNQISRDRILNSAKVIFSEDEAAYAER
jgi:predicted nucleotidyltransferase